MKDNKPCTTCGEVKDPTCYSKDRSKTNGRRSSCKECMKIMDRSYKLKAAYGITLDDYNQMLEDQNDSCAICGIHKDMQYKSMAVDHCHDTMKIRGLLCESCNMGIGKLGDKAEGVRKALRYLEENG